MIKVSVIVPVYNNEKYLDKCIQSILNQTLEDFELIIINDGSNDNSHEIVSKYLEDRRIRYYKKSHKGVGAARNFGIDNSSGKYICFLDSDDYVHESFFEKMYEKCKIEKLDFLVCDYYHYIENNQSIQRFDIPDFENTTLSNSPNLLLDIDLSTSNKFINRDLFMDKKVRFPVGIRYENISLMIRILNESKLIGKINEPLCYFMVHDDSESNIIDKKTFDIFKVLDDVNLYFKNDEYIQEYLEELNLEKILTCVMQQKNQEDKKIRNRFINKSFKYLDKNFPKWKKSGYFKNKNVSKSPVLKSHILTTWYLDLYNLFKNKN